MLLTVPVLESLQVTPRAYRVRLALGRYSFPYLAGQAVLVGVPGDLRRRAYSIASAPEDAARDRVLELLVGVVEVGAPLPFSTADSRQIVDVEGPIGQFTFPPDPGDRRLLFIAGGTGIAPLRAMVRHALAGPHREIGVIYSARTSEEFAYYDELRSLARQGFIDLRLTTTRAGQGDAWPGQRGRIGRAELEPMVRDPKPLCFICGPSAFAAQTYRVLHEIGVPPDQMRVEDHVLKMLDRRESAFTEGQGVSVERAIPGSNREGCALEPQASPART
jgi:NAD(P)H-flavin reductase